MNDLRAIRYKKKLEQIKLELQSHNGDLMKDIECPLNNFFFQRNMDLIVEIDDSIKATIKYVESFTYGH